MYAEKLKVGKKKDALLIRYEDSKERCTLFLSRPLVVNEVEEFLKQDILPWFDLGSNDGDGDVFS